jgi:hypothetical protein
MPSGPKPVSPKASGFRSNREEGRDSMSGGPRVWQNTVLCRGVLRLHPVHASITLSSSIDRVSAMNHRTVKPEEYSQEHPWKTWDPLLHGRLKKEPAIQPDPLGKLRYPYVCETSDVDRVSQSAAKPMAPNRAPSPWSGLFWSQCHPKWVRSTSLGELITEVRAAYRRENLIWLTLATAALAALVLCLSMSA